MERIDSVNSASIENTDAPKRSILQRINDAARSKYSKVLLAVGGAIAAADKAEAGLVYPGEFRPANEINELPEEIAVRFNLREGAFLDIGNAQDATNEAISAIGIYANTDDFAIDFSTDAGSDVTPIINPNSTPVDQILHDHVVIQGESPLAQLQEFRLGMDPDPTTGDQNGPATLNDWLNGATIIVGKNGQLNGQPSTPQEFAEMFSGESWMADYPTDIGFDESYVLTESTSVPEPSSAAYLGIAGAAAGAAAARRRRRSRK